VRERLQTFLTDSTISPFLACATIL
jgi:hypothetical protein